jgi:hypothetical protein
VVVDRVEDHFQTGGMESTDHRLELTYRVVGRRKRLVRCEKPDRVVSPVVRLVRPEEVRFVGERVDREELDRGHAERDEVVQHRRMRQAGVGAPEFGRDVGVCRGDALDMRLVDDGLRSRDLRSPVVTPVESFVGNDASHRVGSGVEVASPLRVLRPMAEDRRVELDVTTNPECSGIEQELRRIAAESPRGIPRPVDAEPVLGPRHGVVDHGPKRVVVAGHLDPPLGSTVEEAQLDRLRHR